MATNIIFNSLIILTGIYFSIGTAHWFAFKQFGRIDFFITAQILAVTYIFATNQSIIGFCISLITVIAMSLINNRINPWKGIQGFIASLMLFTISLSIIQIIFGTIPKIGQIENST